MSEKSEVEFDPAAAFEMTSQAESDLAMLERKEETAKAAYALAKAKRLEAQTRLRRVIKECKEPNLLNQTEEQLAAQGCDAAKKKPKKEPKAKAVSAGAMDMAKRLADLEGVSAKDAEGFARAKVVTVQDWAKMTDKRKGIVVEESSKAAFERGDAAVTAYLQSASAPVQAEAMPEPEVAAQAA